MEQVFAIWPSMADMARDIGENPVTVRQWRRRGVIPAWHDAAIVQAARARGYTLSLADLAQYRAEAYQEIASSVGGA